MSNQSDRPVAADLSIGVIGPQDLVERVMLTSSTTRDIAGDWRLVAAAYRQEREAPAKAAGLSGSIDVCLFTGPLPYDLARQAGVLSVPATFVPLNDAALYSTLLRGVIDQRCDVTRVSIDTLTAAEVGEAYAEIALPTANVQVHEYQGPETPAALAAFHQELWRAGAVSAAVTCVRSVAQQLARAKVPTLRVLPTSASIRNTLHTAALIGTGSRLEESQIAIGIVDAPSIRQSSHGGPFHYWREELKLSLHRVLLQDARRMGATVLPLDEHSFLVVATLGAMTAATDDLKAAPFVDRVRRELGLDIEVGIGLGSTARDAESNARNALARARTVGGGQGFLVGDVGSALALPSRPVAHVIDEDNAPSSGLAVLARLADALPGRRDAEDPVIVDADRTAELLGVTTRTARRLLRTLAHEGLAWPLPPSQPSQRGRPRQSYRLILDKLSVGQTRHRHDPETA